ncbi:hypothetical protein BCR43DRAFT_489939 [Syncephalastrum racemosum]|uniref:Uncharacterized protein n=1 Tax=Syncephalastrum racemosum TaxID=13706 RepID=A0A1X2HGD7_SYNRA|nr:hypothetical protein BCR43DRAFT_489939 [Syncephalastrum racemosum]
MKFTLVVLVSALVATAFAGTYIKGSNNVPSSDNTEDPLAGVSRLTDMPVLSKNGKTETYNGKRQ